MSHHLIRGSDTTQDRITQTLREAHHLIHLNRLAGREVMAAKIEELVETMYKLRADK